VEAFLTLQLHFSKCQYRDKSVIPSMLISVGGKRKNQLQRDQDNMEDTSVLSYCPLLRYPRKKPNGVLDFNVE
jgi:hypothetical protein